jgi:hypothetical protein
VGFNKIAAQAAQRKDGFVPTTDKELKEIRKRAAARDEERTLGKRVKHESSRRDKERGVPRDTLGIKNALLSNQPIRVFRPQLFARFVELCKEREMPPPAYHEYEPRKKADANFLYDIQACCARVPWQRLSELLALGCGKPIPTRDWAEAFHCVLWMMHSAFGVRSNFLDKHKDHVMDRIEDMEALDEWPVTAHKRKRNREEETDMTLEQRNASMRARARDDEDDEDDEDEEDSKARSRDENDEDEDDEDERPARKKKAAAAKKSSKPAKKSSRNKGDDEGDDEDEKPARKKRSAGAVKLEPSTVIRVVKTRDGGGAKGKLFALLTKKGAKYKDILAKAEDEELPAGKVKKWIAGWVGKYLEAE